MNNNEQEKTLTIENFEYKKFSDNLAAQAENLVPEEFSDEEKSYIVETMHNFATMAGEALYQGQGDIELNSLQASIVTQIIAEWTFKKAVELISSKVPKEFWDSILKKIAYVIFDISMQAYKRNMSMNDMLDVIEDSVEKCWNIMLDNLDKKGIEANEYSDDEFDYIEFELDDETGILKENNTSPIENCDTYSENAEYTEDNNQFDEYVQNSYKRIIPEEPLSDTNRLYSQQGSYIFLLCIGNGLLKIADSHQGGLNKQLNTMREYLTDKYGYVIPPIKIMDNPELDEYEYAIYVRNNLAESGYVYPDKYMVTAAQWDRLNDYIPDDAVFGIEPLYNTQAYWINKEDAENHKNIIAANAIDVIVSHLQKIAIKYADEIISKMDVINLMELVRSQDSTLVNDLVPTLISAIDLKKILINLIKEKVSIKDITYIFEQLNDFARFSKDPNVLSEKLRTALKRQISLANADNSMFIYTISLSKEWENLLIESKTSTRDEVFFNLEPEKINELAELAVSFLLKAESINGVKPVIICHNENRLPLYRLLSKYIPTVVVLAYTEISSDVKLGNCYTIGDDTY